MRAEIKQFQEGIETRLEEISKLEVDLAETLDAKEDLLYAEKITSSDLEEATEPALIKTDLASPKTNDKLDGFMGPVAESSRAELSGSPAAVNNESVHIECEEDDGIPIVEAIDLDNHDIHSNEDSTGESFEDSVKKTKSKQGKAVSA